MAETPARLGNHPLHPMLVVFPLGLWVAALAFDIAHAATGNGLWHTIAFWNIVAGIVGALAAAIPGVIDFLALDGRARNLATYHMVLNFAAVVLFAINAYVRVRGAADSRWPLTLSLLGVVGVGVSGWLGGELVYIERVGVEEAPSAKDEQYRRVA